MAWDFFLFITETLKNDKAFVTALKLFVPCDKN